MLTQPWYFTFFCPTCTFSHYPRQRTVCITSGLVLKGSGTKGGSGVLSPSLNKQCVMVAGPLPLHPSCQHHEPGPWRGWSFESWYFPNTTFFPKQQQCCMRLPQDSNNWPMKWSKFPICLNYGNLNIFTTVIGLFCF